MGGGGGGGLGSPGPSPGSANGLNTEFDQLNITACLIASPEVIMFSSTGNINVARSYIVLLFFIKPTLKAHVHPTCAARSVLQK